MLPPATFLLLLASPAPSLPMSAETEGAMTGWTICQRQTQIVLAVGPGTPQSVAEAVMASCEKDQLLFRAAWRKQHGAKVDRLVTNLRENFRMAGVLAVLRLRVASPLTNPIRTWSSCVGAHSIEKGPDEPAETAADRAVDSCLAQEDAVVKEAEQILGPQHGPGVRRRFRSDARNNIIALISDCRAKPDPARSECAPAAAGSGEGER